MEKDVQAILNLLSEGAVVEGDIRRINFSLNTRRRPEDQTPISTNRPD